MLKISNITLGFGGQRALDGVSFEVPKGCIYSIIGPNGAGKTSLLNCINGFYRPSKGEILFGGKDLVSMRPHEIPSLGIGRTFQKIELFRNLRVIDNLLLGSHMEFDYGVCAGGIFFGKAIKQELLFRRRAEEVIDFLEIENWRNSVAGKVPFGVLKRVELGRALCMNPKIILMDEPTCGMNAEETEDFARFIIDIYEELDVTIVLVEHDMQVVMEISHRICVLNYGRKIAEDTPENIRINSEVVEAYLGQ
jgi:branched-chain amino acid transport system ATP-binding protein